MSEVGAAAALGPPVVDRVLVSRGGRWGLVAVGVDDDAELATGGRQRGCGVEGVGVCPVDLDGRPLPIDGVRTYVRVMGLVWSVRVHGQLWAGVDARGDHYAQVSAAWGSGFRAFVSPRGCGHPEGLWLEGLWPSPDEAQDAADRHVVAYVDGVPLVPCEPP